MISTKGRYSIRILLDLAQHRSGKYIPMKDVAARQDFSAEAAECLGEICGNIAKAFTASAAAIG